MNCSQTLYHATQGTGPKAFTAPLALSLAPLPRAGFFSPDGSSAIPSPDPISCRTPAGFLGRPRGRFGFNPDGDPARSG
jgi:hypothetical protein